MKKPLEVYEEFFIDGASYRGNDGQRIGGAVGAIFIIRGVTARS